MRLPDPQTQNLLVHMLPEITFVPRILHDYSGALNERGLQQMIDAYLVSGGKIPTELITQISSQLTGSNGYNLPLITSVVIYIGAQSAAGFLSAEGGQEGKMNPNAMAQRPAAKIYKQLLSSLDAEGRYHVINAMANQLRYPNSHTYFFMKLMFFFFLEGEDEYLQEQITRVLLERLIVHRPHPWGLLVTFIELIKNPRYAFWGHPFTKMNPAIERVFESVSASLRPTNGG